MSQFLDPDLVGIWLLPGQPQTYEITADGGYHIADPEEPVAFEGGGAVMVWGGRRYLRFAGAGETPVGTWREEESGDAWDFAPDFALTILSADAGAATDDAAGEDAAGEDAAGEDAAGANAGGAAGAQDMAFVGIWAPRDGGRSLWTREKLADLESRGALLTYRMATGETYRYGYDVAEGVLRLLDPDTREELTRYVAAGLFHAVADTP